MAWIEAETQRIVNLDNVEYFSVEWDNGAMTLWANAESGHPIYTEESTGGKAQAERLHKLMVQIAQIARGNAYISQDDIREMIKKSDGQT